MANGKRVYLAVDLGASSGRVVAGSFDGQRLTLEELHRFENGMTSAAGSLHWNVLSLWRNIQDGLRQASATLSAGDVETASRAGVISAQILRELVSTAPVLLPNTFLCP